MKTTKHDQKLNARPQNRTERHRTIGKASQANGQTQLPRISFETRNANRRLTTDQLLDLLRTKSTRFFELAEVVGNWVWIRFETKQPPEITRLLSEFGFHWNGFRQVWQHPCGNMTKPIPADPRAKYASYFPAHRNAA